MELNDFIRNFADQFDDTDPSEIKAETAFRDLDEWSSLTGMAVMNMIERKCGKKITITEFRCLNTVEELHRFVESKQ